jgi:CRP-like cAMP-binding protein
MERKVYNWGDIVFKVGEPSDAIYFIVEGEFKLVKEVTEPISEE